MNTAVPLRLSVYSEFFRIIICKSTIEILTYKLGKLTSKIIYGFQQIREVMALCNSLRYPVELIISHRSMTCRSLSTDKLSHKDINSMVKNLLRSRNLNTVFYNGQKADISMCECELSPEFINILEEILKLNILSINVFPFWLVANFINDGVSVFIATFIQYWNIIIVNKNKILYNRTGNIEDFDKDLEIKNTLTHLKTVHNINLRDITIYEMEDQTVESMTKYSRSKMKIASNLADFSAKPINNIINIGYCFCLLISLFACLKNSISVYDVKSKIIYTESLLSNIDFLESLDIYDTLHNLDVLYEPDYQKAISEHLGDKKINAINMTVRGKTIECIV